MNPIEILLVEDNPADVKLMQEALRESAVPGRLAVVGDGEEAAAFLRREGPYAGAPPPDLILLDLHLPRCSGLQLLDELQRDDRLRRIPIVVLAGSVGPGERAELQKRPILRHITKPADLDEYFAAIRAVLDDLAEILGLRRGR
ncbi:MAG: response regulator [Methanomicrobiales archaeon]|nr:response regulator [Methanomicrobiales archaeon]MDI6876784.1 response regulator [Methanomicrobiales archaeon]